MSFLMAFVYKYKLYKIICVGIIYIDFVLTLCDEGMLTPVNI